MSRWTLPFATAEAKQLRQHPTAATLTRAVVLRRCALETLRLTAHTIGAVRLALEPFVLRSGETEYTIQAGETIAISHIASSLDTELWSSDAESWDPWRDEWAVKNDNRVRRAGLSSVLRSGVDDFKFTVFSHGIHRCPGERLALAVVQLTVAELMKHEVALVGALPPLSFERATLAQRAGPVAATIRPRQEPEPGPGTAPLAAPAAPVVAVPVAPAPHADGSSWWPWGCCARLEHRRYPAATPAGFDRSVPLARPE